MATVVKLKPELNLSFDKNRVETSYDTYDLMIKTNRYLIRGGELNDAQKANIACRLLAERDAEATDARVMKQSVSYPKFYVPPHNNGKRLQTIIPMSPKTFQVADNAYEFEIIRLLHLFTQSND
jgi:hypothetical protein